MTITADSVVVGVPPDMSAEKFKTILELTGSPAAPFAAQGYQEIVEQGVSPAFALAIFEHESRFGHAGLVPQYDLKNPGATRSTRTGEGAVISIPGRGSFVRYPMWTQGWADLAYRLVDPSYVYAQEGRKTVRQIIERWAPASDNNVPSSYIKAVVTSMNEWIEPMSAQIQIPGVEVEWYVWHDDDGNRHVGADSLHYTRGRTATIRQIVHHHSDGWDSRDWLTHTSPNNVSAHLLVSHDGTKVWQLVRLEDTAHTQGRHNPWSVSTEWERKWPEQEQVPERVYDTLAKLDRAIRNYSFVNRLGTFNLTRAEIKRHDEVNDTSCPMNLDVDRIAQILKEGSVPGEREINGYKVSGPFLTAYRALETSIGAHWWTLGVPVGATVPGVPVDGTNRTVQPWDRCGWLMTEGAGVVIPKPSQVRQIEEELDLSGDLNISRARLHDLGEALGDFSKELLKA